jgi:hypothetical protein
MVTHEKLNSWFMVAALALLGWMAKTLTDISQTLAVAVSRVDYLEAEKNELKLRVTNLETLVFNPR